MKDLRELESEFECWVGKEQIRVWQEEGRRGERTRRGKARHVSILDVLTCPFEMLSIGGVDEGKAYGEFWLKYGIWSRKHGETRQVCADWKALRCKE